MEQKSGKPKTGRVIALAFIAALFMKFFLLDFMIIEGHSMTPAIKPGALIIVCKIFYGIRLPFSGKYIVQWKAPEKGDVVVFYTPFGDIAVKRCGGNTNGDVFYAVGDNGEQSYDSRSYGPVPVNQIIGKVLGM